MRARSLVVAAALVSLLPACATRGTIRELGHPEFEPIFKDKRLTVAEPATQGEFNAYAKEVGEVDHRSGTQMLTAPHVEGTDVVFDMVAASRGAAKLDLLQVLAFPIASKDLAAWKLEGKLPDPEHPAAAVFNAGKYVPGTSNLRVDVKVPVDKIGSAENLALPTLLGFEDGWVTIVYNVVPVPKP
jgi:hypothetical protein